MLDAIKGTSITVPTIFGDRTVDVKKRSRNADVVTLRGVGVAGSGDQIVTLDVAYPDDIEVFVECLRDKT